LRGVRAVLVVLSGILVLIVALIVGLLAAARPGTTDVPLEVAKGLINLAVAIVVTGALSFLLATLLAKQAREQAQHDDRMRTLTAASQDFKAGAEQAFIVRFLISTNPSAKTLTEQLTSLVEARARLQRVQREPFLRDDPHVNREIKRMLRCLDDLGIEYRSQYPYIAREALAEEAAREAVLRGDKENAELRSLLPDPRFPKLAEFILDEGGSLRAFQESYDYVKNWLEQQLNSSAVTGRGKL
jgi:hypothetical protein